MSTYRLFNLVSIHARTNHRNNTNRNVNTQLLLYDFFSLNLLFIFEIIACSLFFFRAIKNSRIIEYIFNSRTIRDNLPLCKKPNCCPIMAAREIFALVIVVKQASITVRMRSTAGRRAREVLMTSFHCDFR